MTPPPDVAAASVVRPVAWGGAGWGPAPAEVTEAGLGDGAALQGLLDELHRRQPHPDVGLITRAFETGRQAHADQRRQSGEPFFIHPVRVAYSIARLGLDCASVAAALLHDTVEDSGVTIFELTEQFGREVANIVNGVTKLGKVPYLSRAVQQAESFRKMLLAMSQDIRVLIVKLLDRLDNMRTLQHMAREKQERISQETMRIHAPLANRLGLEGVRRELQDLAFGYLDPKASATIRRDIDAVVAKDIEGLQANLAGLRAAFDGASPQCRPKAPLGHEEYATMRWPERAGSVEVRATMRTPYRVHRRREKTNRNLSMSDVVTIQIITADRASCYAALGLIHAHFRPIPSRFRDYVALPRPNHYQALHSSVVGRDGARLEIQIRSAIMDDVAYRGIVVAWKDGQAPGVQTDQLEWLHDLMDWQDDISDPNEFIEAVKAELFADETYVFTPEGDVHTFPKQSTPIDFAFAIHTDVGMHCSGARVNGQVVPLRYHLRQGDTVEIITNPNAAPRPEWLTMCETSRAKARIRQHLRQEERSHLREVGRSLVEQVLKGRGLDLGTYESEGWIAEQGEALGLARDARDEEGVYAAVGSGQVEAETLARALATRAGQPSDDGPAVADGNLLARVFRSVRSRRKEGQGTAVGATPSAPCEVTRDRVIGVAGSRALIELAACCSPVPGDSLIGMFEPGRGITAHVEGCPDVLEQFQGRRVYLQWEEGLTLERPVTIEVRTGNKVGLLAEMSRAFSRADVNIRQANCRSFSNGERAINTFAASVASRSQLEALLVTLKGIDGVLSVERVFTAGSGIYERLA